MTTHSIPASTVRFRRAIRPLVAAAVLVALLVLAGFVALWPGFVLVTTAVACVGALARLRPAYGFLLALALFASEGSVKALVMTGGTPLPLSDRVVAAGLLDLSLVIGVVGVVTHAGGSGLRARWREVGVVGQTVVGLLVAWLLISFGQASQSPDPAVGIAGFRLTHAYLIALVGGLFAFARQERRDPPLAFGLAALAAIAGYAVFRAVFGPADVERAYAVSRGGVGLIYAGPEIRTFGSFSDPVALASFLVPTAVFALTIGALAPRHRKVGLIAGFAAIAGILASQVRTGVLAVAVGLALAAVLGLSGRLVSRRYVAVASVVVALAGAAGVVTSPGAEDRARARLQAWSASVRTIDEHPFGTGLGTAGLVASPLEPVITADNTYLKALREQGVVGLLFVVSIIGATVLVGWRLARRPATRAPLAVASFAGFLSFAVLAAGGNYFEQPGKVLAWAFLGVAVSEAFRAGPRKQ